MSTDTDKTIGFQRSEPFGDDPRGIGWRAWAGPLLLCRTRGFRFSWWCERPHGWSLCVLGVSIGWTR